MQFYATEYVHMKYPRMPLESIEQLVDDCVGDLMVGNVARGVGVPGVMRWQPTVYSPPFVNKHKKGCHNNSN